MQAGKLRHKIIIQESTETISDVGEPIQAWTTYKTVYASIEPLDGREYWSARQSVSEVTGKIRTRHTAGITTDMRVKFGSRIFNIEAVLNPEERNTETVLLVKENT